MHSRTKRFAEAAEGPAGCGEDGEGLCASGLQGALEGAGLIHCAAEEPEGRASGKGVAKTIECEQFAVAPDGSSQRLQVEMSEHEFWPGGQCVTGAVCLVGFGALFSGDFPVSI